MYISTSKHALLLHQLASTCQCCKQSAVTRHSCVQKGGKTRQPGSTSKWTTVYRRWDDSGGMEAAEKAKV